MSTLLTTASTSVADSHKGLPVSRAIRSANSSFLPRTALAKRRRVSTRKARGLDAQPDQAWRARATASSTSPLSPVHRVAPVAGSVDWRLVMAADPPFLDCAVKRLSIVPKSGYRFSATDDAATKKLEPS